MEVVVVVVVAVVVVEVVVVVVLVEVVVVVSSFMEGMTILSVICFLETIKSSIFPPQFLTQLSPVMKLFPFPPHPLYLNYISNKSIKYFELR